MPKSSDDLYSAARRARQQRELLARRPVKPELRKKNKTMQAYGRTGWDDEYWDEGHNVINPRKVKVSKNLIKARAALKGRPPWNKGLTKETSKILQYLSDLRKWKLAMNSDFGDIGYWPE